MKFRARLSSYRASGWVFVETFESRSRFSNKGLGLSASLGFNHSPSLCLATPPWNLQSRSPSTSKIDKACHQWNYYGSCSCSYQKFPKRGNHIPMAPTTSIKLLDKTFNLPTPFLTSDPSKDICLSSLSLGQTSQIISIGHSFGLTAWPSQCFRSQHFLHSSLNLFVKAGFK